MTTAVPSPGARASASRHASSDTAARVLRRPPVLLRLPALQGSPPAEPTAPPPRALEESTTTQTDAPELQTAPAEPSDAPFSQNRRGERQASRRERKPRTSREPAKKPALSQWVLGACMLVTGVLGFFALSGDFGETSDAPPADGWSQRAESSAPDSKGFAQPESAPAQAITVHREPTAAPQDPGNYANPAEGEIVQTPRSQPADGPTNFMGAPPAPADSGQITSSPSLVTGAVEAAPGATQATSLEGSDPLQLAPPQNGAGGLEANTSPANNPYPATGAAGLSPLTTPAQQGRHASHPGTGQVQPPTASGPPAVGSGTLSAAPGFPAAPSYPGGSAYPSPQHRTTGYPTTGASAAPYPSNLPSATIPRYEFERIR